MGTAEGSEDTADTINAAKTASTPAAEPVGVAPGMHDVHKDNHHTDHNTVEASEDDHEECDGACDICGEHHDEHGGPSMSLLAALSRVMTQKPETAEERAKKMLNELMRGASTLVDELISVADSAMVNVNRILTILPADDRDRFVVKLEQWVAAAKIDAITMRAGDVTNGRPTSALPTPPKDKNTNTDATV